MAPRAFAKSLLIATGVLVACDGEGLGGQGASCQRANDCRSGLVCIEERCSDDLSGVGSMVPPPPVPESGGSAGIGGATGTAGAGGVVGSAGSAGAPSTGGATSTGGAPSTGGAGGAAGGGPGTAGSAGSDMPPAGGRAGAPAAGGAAGSR
ncbi:MAG TPA: hypothetical protein VKZ49_17415 [Polyangiaceae bacterium]|nr:hypothetical protein [Polyangiaceae bacterium]